jgi:two-component system chemotaxis response regulator CheB
MAKIRVLIVEDSSTVRGRLRDVLAAEFDIVGEAADGAQAIEMCRRTRPDVITMDMMLPTMTGLAATEHIMAHSPTPILVVSSSANRGEVLDSYDAIAAGAVDVLEKPTGLDAAGAWEERLVATVRLVSRIRVIVHPRAALNEIGERPAGDGDGDDDAAGSAAGPRESAVIGIGASTGGPAAIVELLAELPAVLTVPVLLVQHIDATFAAAFADWLGQRTGRDVADALEWEPVAATVGRIVVAPADQHLLVRHGLLRLSGEPRRHSCRPSVDVLFESMAREYGPAAAGCLLSGIGRDGAAGLLKLREAGALTMAQDEASSTVYGMPREAALLRAASKILPPDQLGRQLARLVFRAAPTPQVSGS